LKASPLKQYQIHLSNEAYKRAVDFAVSNASACSVVTRKIPILGRKCEVPGQDGLLKTKESSENYGKKPGIQHTKRQ
jgi:hypothetical protein